MQATYSLANGPSQIPAQLPDVNRRHEFLFPHPEQVPELGVLQLDLLGLASLLSVKRACGLDALFYDSGDS
jgi:hypothetical protein